MNGMMRLVAWLLSLRRALLDVMVAEHTEHLTSNPELFDSIATMCCVTFKTYIYTKRQLDRMRTQIVIQERLTACSCQIMVSLQSQC